MQADTTSFLESVVIVCFIGTWFVLGVGGGLFFYLGKTDVALKRKWFPRYVWLVGALFVFFSSTLAVLSSGSFAGLGILVFVVPMVILISVLNVKLTKFCDECGGIRINSNWFTPMRFCSKCGAELDAKPKRLDDLLG